MTPMVTVTYDSSANKFYSGTTKGEIYTWDGNQCVKAQKLHEGSIMALTWTDGKLLSSG